MKVPIIIKPIITLNKLPAKKPINVPHPDFKASFSAFPDNNSATKAPIIGPTMMPINPKNIIPNIPPIMAPQIPAFEAPYFFAPKTPA